MSIKYLNHEKHKFDYCSYDFKMVVPALIALSVGRAKLFKNARTFLQMKRYCIIYNKT